MENTSKEDLCLKNCMEDIVFTILDEVMPEEGICKCAKCRLDIAAQALNHLPPKYAVTQTGKVYFKALSLHQQFEVDVVTAILNAIKVVSENPQHDIKDL